MTDTTQKERCARGCIWLGAGVGLAAILMFWLLAGWGVILSIAAGVILGAICAFAFTFLFCGNGDAAEPAHVKPRETAADASVADAGAVASADDAPAVAADDVAAPSHADEADAVASEPAAASSATAAAVAAEPAEKAAFSGIKPSKELKGQQELAARKGSYKYVAPAADKPVAAKVAAPAEAAPAETTTPAAFADIPAADAADGGADIVETQPEILTAARAGGADDLKRISGVGPKLEQTLNELGFYHFDQVAKWGASEIAWVDSRLRFKGRILRDNWVAQAKILAEGGETEFSARKK